MEKVQGERDLVQRFSKLIKGEPVVIFGCGIRGERLMLFCDRHKIRISSFCDNNTALYGEKKFGFPIISPYDIKEEIILLSMKNGWEQVRNQLLEMGIKSDRIIEQIPEGIL